MTGAMYAAVSGLRAHMQGLNVIGNNVANVNTDGYKAGRYVFESALYTSISNGSNGSTTVGGKNPSQIGMGAKMASVDIDMSTSTYVPTGRPMDCMIDGDGFFLLGKTKDMTFTTAEDFKSLILTRVGDLNFKADGTLTNRAGDVVYGFQCKGYLEEGDTTVPVVSNQLSPISLPKVVKVTKTDDTTNPPTTTVEATVVYSREQFEKLKTADNTITGDFDDLKTVEMESISIDEKTGRVSGTTKDTDQHITIGFIAIGNVVNPNGVTQMTGTYYQCGDGAGDMSISMLGGSAAEVYDAGKFEDAALGADGVWNRGDVAKGMTHITTDGSAPVLTGDDRTPDSMAIGTGGTTGLLTSGLEQTNTDLATEISNMIFMQRGYQANTRIVTVTDSMLEELVNMKR